MISFAHIDDAQGCPESIRFPTQGDELTAALTAPFHHARQDVADLLNTADHAGNGTLHHLIDGEDMAVFAQQRLEQLLDNDPPDWFEGSLVSLNCGERQRMFGYLNGADRTYMPIWWDPHHTVSGHNPNYPT